MEAKKYNYLKKNYNYVSITLENKLDEIVKKYGINKKELKEWVYFTFIYFENNNIRGNKRDFYIDLFEISNWFEEEINSSSKELKCKTKEVFNIYNIIGENLDKLLLEEFQEYKKEYIHNKENEKIKFLPRYNFGLNINGFGHPGIILENTKFEQCVFSNLKFKDCIIKNCFVLQSLIKEYSYLRKAIFINVDFTGTIFSSCNLEKATFENCNLSYVKFENCILDIEAILESSLPNESNLKLGLIRQLYNNELQQGRIDSANKLLDILMESEENYYKDILFNNTEYFRNKRKRKVFRYLFKYIKCVFNRYIWGNGIKIFRMTFTMFIITIIFSCLYYFTVFKNEAIIADRIVKSIIQSCSSFLISNLATEQLIETNHKVFVLIQNVLGLVYFAFLTSALYRRIAR